MRRKKQKPRNIYGQVISAISDVRELHLRETKMNTRKGMKKIVVVPQGMTGEQLLLWKKTHDHDNENTSMEPEYIKKLKNR